MYILRVSPLALKVDYLLNHKEPLWVVDNTKSRVVLELDRVDISPKMDPHYDCYIFEFTLTYIKQNQEIRYELFVDPVSGHPEFLYNLTTNEAYTDLNSFGSIKEMVQLVKLWFKDWKGQHNISQVYPDFEHLTNYQPVEKPLVEIKN
jgi:hypothetical protein